MKKFAIAYIDCFYDLKLYFIKAATIKEAILNTIEKEDKDIKQYLPDNFREITRYYLSKGAEINVKEIPKDF